jgi:predicted lipase
LINAWWLAEASLLAYAESEFATKVFRAAGFEVDAAQPFSGLSTQCYVAHTDRAIIVAFRGTQVYKPGLNRPLDAVLRDEVSDIFLDANFQFVPWTRGGHVHKGFQQGLDEIWKDKLEPYLVRLTRTKPKCSVWFTGHSLGGALATLAADRFDRVDGVYTFGSPRVGEAVFINGFRAKHKTYRFVNNNDIVARVPLIGPYEKLSQGAGIYKHVGRLKYINSAGEMIDNPSDWNRFIDDFRGSFGHLAAASGRMTSGGLAELPVDHLNDHAPIYYAVHIWNQYERGLALRD